MLLLIAFIRGHYCCLASSIFYMKKIILAIGIVSLSTLYWCTLFPTTPSINNPTTSWDVDTWDHQPPLSTGLAWPSNEYTLLFSGTMKEVIPVFHKSGEPTKLFFINSEASSMKVEVSFLTGEQGNLRRSQVILPDGTWDWPFGMSTQYALTQFGWYQLIFNESMMSGDPRSGNAQISITLKK